MRKIKMYTDAEMCDRGDQYMARAIDTEELDEDYDPIEYCIYWDVIVDTIEPGMEDMACDWTKPSQIIESPYWCSRAVTDETVIIYDTDNRELCRVYLEG